MGFVLDCKRFRPDACCRGVDSDVNAVQSELSCAVEAVAVQCRAFGNGQAAVACDLYVVRNHIVILVKLIAADAVAACLGNGALAVDNNSQFLVEEGKDTCAEVVLLSALSDLRVIKSECIFLRVKGRGTLAALYGEVILGDLLIVDPEVVRSRDVARYNIDAEVVGYEFHCIVVSVVAGFHIGQTAVFLLAENLCFLVAARDFYNYVALGLNGLAALCELDVISLIDLIVTFNLDCLKLSFVCNFINGRCRLGLCSHLNAARFLLGVACGRNELLRLNNQTAVTAVNARRLARGGRCRLYRWIVNLPVTVRLSEVGFAALTAVLAVGQCVALLGAGGIYLLGFPLVTRCGKDRIFAVILVAAFTQIDHQAVRRAGGRNRR